MRGRPWTQQQIADLFRMRDAELMSFVEIERVMGRPKNAASTKYHAVLSARTNEISLAVTAASPAPKARAVPAREQFRHRSLTAFVFGDPPPGRSALDVKRATEKVP